MWSCCAAVARVRVAWVPVVLGGRGTRDLGSRAPFSCLMENASNLCCQASPPPCVCHAWPPPASLFSVHAPNLLHISCTCLRDPRRGMKRLPLFELDLHWAIQQHNSSVPSLTGPPVLTCDLRPRLSCCSSPACLLYCAAPLHGPVRVFRFPFCYLFWHLNSMRRTYSLRPSFTSRSDLFLLRYSLEIQ